MTMQETHPIPRAAGNGHGRQEPDTRPGWYYVTIRDGSRHGLLGGPFVDDHPAALAWVRKLWDIAELVNSRAMWATFGTSWSPVDRGPGKLHDGQRLTEVVWQLAGTNSRLAELLIDDMVAVFQERD